MGDAFSVPFILSWWKPFECISAGNTVSIARKEEDEEEEKGLVANQKRVFYDNSLIRRTKHYFNTSSTLVFTRNPTIKSNGFTTKRLAVIREV